ncbi:SPBc2 prophage-derived aminoglycoside N(3')-acetyltransferase-like protein YokD [Rubripirellula tenax]|uniref:Aminoglycoside N(3)-acetyltransferase n=1 Tax=Rubripirellula tenax TaxID=2528015 RepID=A0A5C6F1L7_9BACT|nr:AAC(3) family N-acetyltransferase [Rubripirellula tenax]TWU54484.1 SPBc2 prophage-derived aminoglycoside N(3')-acetyltransferase-like protein YokD [Rubripirellula tenax]
MSSLKYRLKRRLKAIHRYISSPHLGPQALSAHFEELGLRRGGIVLVHSSLSSLGYVPGGAHSVIEALIKYLGNEGTLMMPAHTWIEVNRGKRSFSQNQDPTHVGHIAETFRRWPGVVRSAHPTHSVTALGPLASQLTHGHLEAESPCGENTPYGRMMENDGQIFLLGVELKRNTCFHSVEAIADVPYLLKPTKDEFDIELTTGELKKSLVRCHQRAIPSRFNAFKNPLSQSGCLREAKLGHGSSIVIDALPFRDFMLKALEMDPDVLLDRSSTSFGTLVELCTGTPSTMRRPSESKHSSG